MVGVMVGVIVAVIVGVIVVVGVIVGVTVLVCVGVGVGFGTLIEYGILRPPTPFTTIILVAPSGKIIGTPIFEFVIKVKS
jgi:hypothetical protein